MNRSDLSAAVAEAHGLSNTKATEIVNDVVGRIAGALNDGEDVHLVGFGTFKRVTRAARAARNPKTGEPVQVAAKSTVKFKPSPQLQREVKAKKSK